MHVVTKATAQITPVDDDTSETGAFDVILSAQTLDRDGDVLKSDEWLTPLPEHITFDIDHGLSVATTVGSGAPFINDDGDLQVRGTFSSIPRAQEVRTLVREGHIRTTSVAFQTVKGSKSAGGIKRELLNGAFVAVPSNREAVVLSSKSASVPQSGAEHNQAIHDHSTAMGAVCAPSQDDSGDSEGANKTVTHYVTKGISGSIEDLQSRISDELRERYPDTYPWIRATFLDSSNSGTVVYCLDDGDTLSRSFTDDGATTELGDEVLEVSIVTSVVVEDDTTKTLTTAAETKATDASAAIAAEEKSAADVELRARGLLITNEALFN